MPASPVGFGYVDRIGANQSSSPVGFGYVDRIGANQSSSPVGGGVTPAIIYDVEVDDAVVVLDVVAVEILADKEVSVSDTVATLDAVFIGLDLGVKASDSIAVADYLEIEGQGLCPAIVDTIEITDRVVREHEAVRCIVDVITIVDRAGFRRGAAAPSPTILAVDQNTLHNLLDVDD